MISEYSESKLDELWRVINVNIKHDEARSVPAETEKKKEKRQVPPPLRKPPAGAPQPETITAEELLAELSDADGK
jgi:hypothetical protein